MEHPMAEAANKTEKFTRKPRVAYFSMEIAMESDIPTYSRGLEVQAGVTLRAAADIGVPMVAVKTDVQGRLFSPGDRPTGPADRAC
jgi:starch phosphorylase